MDAAERQLESQRATDLLERAVRRRGAAVVALFSPLPDEIDIAPLAARLGDVRIVLPRVEDTRRASRAWSSTTTVPILWPRARTEYASRRGARRAPPPI